MSIKFLEFHNQPAALQIKQVKSEAKSLRRTNHKDKPHKYYLNLVSRKYGYASYDDLFFKFQSEFQIWRDYGKDNCLSRLSEKERSYYFVTMHEDFQYSYYSHWTGWDDDGYELRAPSLIRPEFFIENFREKLSETLYVIHDKEECFRWMAFWKGRALVDSTVITSQIICFLEPSRSYSHPRRLEHDPEM